MADGPLLRIAGGLRPGDGSRLRRPCRDGAAVAANIFGVEGLGELLGILFTGFGVACLVGPPLAGFLVDRTLDYHWPVFVAACAAVLALIVVIPLRRYGAARDKTLAAAAD